MKGILKFLSGLNDAKIDSTGDIKVLPRQNGVLLFPISIGKIEKEMSAENIFNFLETELHSKWRNYPLSIVFLYTGNVYSKYGFDSKKNNDYKVEKHKLECTRIINYSNYLTMDAFSFVDWNDLFNSDSYVKEKFEELKNIYLSDQMFQNIMKSDLKRAGKSLDSNNINFLLEEMFLPYLFVKNKIDVKDKFTKNTKKFKLICYSGNSPKILLYIHKMNFFNLDKSTNVYQNCFYNYKSKFLFNFDDIDLENVSDLGQYVIDFRKNN